MCRHVVLQAGSTAWYGGGCDLTPAYLFEDDARAFHGYWRSVCDRHHPSECGLVDNMHQPC